MTDDELLEARKRAQEYRKMAEEECPNGGFLLGDCTRENNDLS